MKMNWVLGIGIFFLCATVVAQDPQRYRRSRKGLTEPLLKKRAVEEPGVFKMTDPDTVFSEAAGDEFEELISPFTRPAKRGKLTAQEALRDFSDGCRNLASIFVSKKYTARWVGAFSRVRPQVREACLVRAARVLNYLQSENKITMVDAVKMRREIESRLSSEAETQAFSTETVSFKYRKPQENKPEEKHDIYFQQADGAYDFMEFDPRYPNLLFSDSGVFQKSGDGYAQILDVDAGKGRLTAEGYLAQKGVHDDLARWLSDEKAKPATAENLERNAKLGALLHPGLEGQAKTENLQNIVDSLLKLREEDKARKTERGQTGLALQQVIDYLSADPARADDLHRLEWALTKFSSVKGPENPCEAVCSLFAPDKYEIWRTGDTGLAEGSKNSIHLAYVALQARFALEARAYCPNEAEVDKVFFELVKTWRKARENLSGDTENGPYQAYARAFAVLYLRRLQTPPFKDNGLPKFRNSREPFAPWKRKLPREGFINPSNPADRAEVERLLGEMKKNEKMLEEDLSDPKLNQDHAGGSNLGNTTFHLAYSVIGSPQNSEATKKAIETLQKVVDTCKAVTGSPYRIPYDIVFTDGGAVDPNSCLQPSANEDGAAARVVPVYLALYLKGDFVSAAHRNEAKKALEGALEKLYLYSFDLKSHVPGNRTHAGSAQKAPYYWYPALAMASSALSILERDYPAEQKRYAERKSAFRSTAWEMWNQESGLFDTHGGIYKNSDQFNQPLAGLAMLGMGVCQNGNSSFGLVDPLLDVPTKDTLKEFQGQHRTFDTSQLNRHQPAPVQPGPKAPAPRQRR